MQGRFPPRPPASRAKGNYMPCGCGRAGAAAASSAHCIAPHRPASSHARRIAPRLRLGLYPLPRHGASPACWPALPGAVTCPASNRLRSCCPRLAIDSAPPRLAPKAAAPPRLALLCLASPSPASPRLASPSYAPRRPPALATPSLSQRPALPRLVTRRAASPRAATP
jgi:hypothetical protein